eukprot:277695_1
MIVFVLSAFTFIMELYGSFAMSNQCTFCETVDFTIAVAVDTTMEFTLGELSNFNESVFNDLQDVHQVIQKETDLEMLVVRDAFFNAFGQILVRHGTTDVIGATILHNHFHLNEKEILILNASADDDIEFVSYPETTELCDDEGIPYMFRYTVSDGSFSIHPLQYIVNNDAVKERFDAVFADHKMLLEIGSILVHFNLIDSVGVFIDYYDGSGIINEVTNVSRRTQEFRVNHDAEARPSLITAYSFKNATCAQTHTGCEISCNAETVCHSYCESNEYGHSAGHNDRYEHSRYHD